MHAYGLNYLSSYRTHSSISSPEVGNCLLSLFLSSSFLSPLHIKVYADRIWHSSHTHTFLNPTRTVSCNGFGCLLSACLISSHPLPVHYVSLCVTPSTIRTISFLLFSHLHSSHSTFLSGFIPALAMFLRPCFQPSFHS